MASSPPPMEIDPARTYTLTMTTSLGKIVIALDPQLAPNTVNSLVSLARRGFYDGLTFHRVSRGFVIQGGDPRGDGRGGPGYQTVDAPPAGFRFERGMVAMAKTASDPPGAAGSQFFIVTGTTAPLDSSPVYAVVGRVTEGMDVAQAIGEVPLRGGTSDGPPQQTVRIEQATVTEG